MDFEPEIVWSDNAKKSWFAVLDYLNENWTQKELIQFNQRVQLTLAAIRKNPSIFPISARFPMIRKAIIDRNNLLFYTADPHRNKIFLLTFFDCRQNPGKLTRKLID